MRSQRHVLDLRGKDSAGNVKGLGAIIYDKCIVQNNANAGRATIRLDGYFRAAKAVSVNVAHNVTSATVTYTPATQEDANTAAAGLAAAINGDATVGALVTATSAGEHVFVVSTSTATNGDKVVLSSLSITN